MRTGGGPDQLDTSWVPSRRPIVTKFSVRAQIDLGSGPAKFGERGSIDADVVNYAYDGGPGRTKWTGHDVGSVASRCPISAKFSGDAHTGLARLPAKFHRRPTTHSKLHHRCPFGPTSNRNHLLDLKGPAAHRL